MLHRRAWRRPLGAGVLAIVFVAAGWLASAASAQDAAKSLPLDLGYFHGDRFEPVALEAGSLSVRFESAVSEEAARARLAALPAVDAAALAATAFSERGSLLVPLRAGLAPEAVLSLASALSLQEDVAFAAPVVRRGGAGPVGEVLGLTNRLHVALAKHVGPADARVLFALHGLRIVRPLPYLEHGYLVELSKGAPVLALDVARALYASGACAFAEPEFVVDRRPRHVPNDPLYASQWHLHSSGQNGSKVDADVDAPEAWDVTRGAASVVVAVIDGGVQFNHPDLNANQVAGWDVLGNDSSPLPSGTGDNHGTAVAGVACARGDNALGLSGVAPLCKMMPIRLVGSGMTTTDEADAIEYARSHGAAVINNSWGPPDGTGANYPLPSAVKAAIDAAVTSGRGGKGCVIFWASGNGNESVNLDGYASYANVIAVGASTNQDVRSWYSDYGSALDVVAPSNGGTGYGIYTTDRTGSAGYASSDYTSSFGGTSSACPLAAGVGALVVSQNPNLTTAQVRGILTSTADKIDPAGGAYNASGFSNLYGYGKVNAAAAVAAAGGGGPPGGFTTFTSGDVPKSIPDNQTAGVYSNLSVSGLTGTITDFDVTVNVTHSYKGDLKLTLIAPDGAQLVLHDRTGGSADHVQTTFDTATQPAQALSGFFGKSGNGTWRLWLQDLAAQDLGTLQSWSIAIKAGGSGGGGPVTQTHPAADVPKSVPDNQTAGVYSNLAVSQAGALTEVNVAVNVTHTYKGDLKVTLVHPDGTQVVLHNRTGGSADHVNTTYDTLTAPAQSLAALNGKAAAGTWRLWIQDLAAQDLGTLQAWSLQLTSQ